jgi:hypothetical protein
MSGAEMSIDQSHNFRLQASNAIAECIAPRAYVYKYMKLRLHNLGLRVYFKRIFELIRSRNGPTHGTISEGRRKSLISLASESRQFISTKHSRLRGHVTRVISCS